MRAKVGLCILGLFLGVIGLEFTLRISNTAPEITPMPLGRFRLSANPRIGIEPIPFATDRGPVAFSKGRVGYKEAFNSMGFRDTEHEIPKPSHRKRIVVIGDSISMGNFVEDMHDAYPRRLEVELSKQDKEVEVINLGVTGYNTIQEVAMLKERGLQFKPDLVILQYCLNDTRVEDSKRLRALLKRKESSSTIPQHWLPKGSLHTALEYSALARSLYNSFANIRTPNDYKDIFNDGVEESLRELEELSSSAKFKSLLVVFPTRNMYSNKELKAHSTINKRAQTANIPTLDLLKDFERCAKEQEHKLWHDYYHPTKHGHLCAAQGIASYLVANDLP